MTAKITRYTVAFGRFWWDFLVGDTPELFVGVLLVVGAGLGLRHERWAAVATVPVLTIAILAMTTFRGRKRSPVE